MLNTQQSWQSPMAVIAHIDLDAFYAQCLTVKEGLDPKEPLGCRQWNSLIAVNYPARPFGVKRGMLVKDALEKCPQIHLPHVPVFHKGSTQWEFPRTLPTMANNKVSLDFFRRESRKIFRVLKDGFSKVEKAGIDEGFVDLGPEVYDRACEIYPELRMPRKGAEMPNCRVSIDMKGRFDQSTEEFQTWHDVLTALGSCLVWDIRIRIQHELHYTCSAGIASNKLVAKLASAYKKPFNQTTISETQITKFLDNCKITDCWGWGGKLGKMVVDSLQVPEEKQFAFLRQFTLEELQMKFDPGLSMQIHELAHGGSPSEIHQRTTVKSLASVKNFTNSESIKSRKDVHDWLRVFCADLLGRIVDQDEDTGGCWRPRTMVTRFFDKDRQIVSRQRRTLDLSAMGHSKLSEGLFAHAKALVEEHVPLPCWFLAIELTSLVDQPKEKLAFEKQEKLWVDDEDVRYFCLDCHKTVEESEQEHKDWHLAKRLALETDISTRTNIKEPRSKVQKSTPKKRPNQKSLTDFWRKN